MQENNWIAEKRHFLLDFIEYHQKIVATIGEKLSNLPSDNFSEDDKALLDLLHQNNRKVQFALSTIGQGNNNSDVEVWWATLLHEIQAPYSILSGAVEFLNTVQLSNIDQESFNCIYRRIAEGVRSIHLSQEIVLMERTLKANPKTAVSLLQLLQEPSTYNKRVRIQISGDGARQTIVAHRFALSTAVNQIYWVLANEPPQNCISIDSAVTETAVTLTFKNDAITLDSNSIEKFRVLKSAPHLYYFDQLNGVALPLALAHKLLAKRGGQLSITAHPPTQLKLTLPLSNTT